MRVYTRRMRIRRLIAVVSLAICIGAPLAECLDRWDTTAYGNDTEGQFVVVAMCAGLALCAPGALLAFIRASSSCSTLFACVRSDLRVNLITLIAAPIPQNSSPPLALRI